MSRYLLDTDVIIEILRSREGIVSQVEELFSAGHNLFYSPISKAEIYQGIRKGEELNTARFFDQLDCLVIDDEIGEKAGSYLKIFRKSHNLELADALIAASASQAKATLFTFNRRHYPMKDIKFYPRAQSA
jgi:predicted nucleic acid-binding protein